MTPLWTHSIVWLHKRINVYKDSHIAECAVLWYCVTSGLIVVLDAGCFSLFLLSFKWIQPAVTHNHPPTFKKLNLPLKIEIHQKESAHVFTDSIFILTRELVYNVRVWGKTSEQKSLWHRGSEGPPGCEGSMAWRTGGGQKASSSLLQNVTTPVAGAADD